MRALNGMTALYNAASAGHDACVALLLDAGAETEAATATSLWTPLHASASNGHMEVNTEVCMVLVR